MQSHCLRHPHPRGCRGAASPSSQPDMVVTQGRSSRGGGGGAAAGDDRVPLVAALLGAGGLLPFVWYAAQHEPVAGATAPPRGDRLLRRLGDAVGVAPPRWLLAGDQATVRRRYITYGASILSFMGAVHWGVAMMSRPKPGAGPYLVSVVPSLLGWAACDMDTRSARPYAALAAGFLGIYLYDEARLAAKAVPPWYTKLRTPLTVVVAATAIGSAAAIREKEGV